MISQHEAGCYQRIFGQHHTVMLIIDPATGRILQANPAAADYYGWSMPELLQKNIAEINMLSPEQVRAEMAKALGQQRNFFEFQHRLANGRVRDVEARSTPVVWDGRPALCSMVTDVTERNEAERALRQVNSRLEQLVAERTEQVTAANEELHALNEELAAQNEEIIATNQRLEQRVEARTGDLAAAHQEVLAQCEELQTAQNALVRNAKIQLALRQIAEAAILAASLDLFYQAVHQQVCQVLHADGVYISLLDVANQQLVRPFLVDPVSGLVRLRPVAKGWTEYVIRTGEVQHITQDRLEQLLKAGEVDRTIAGFHEWVGAPLVDAAGDCFGALSLVATHASHSFSASDIGVLKIIAAQVALAVEHRTTKAVFRENEARREQALRHDIEMAGRVQSELLKLAAPSAYLAVTTLYQPYGYVGGDLYFMDWRYEGTLLRGYLLDATGHGLSTALHTASMHVLLREVNELDLPLPEQMRWLNRRASQYFDEATFAGALGFELDLQVRQLRWCCAGIPLVWLATADRQGLESCSGLYLGICSTESYELHTVELAVGDAVCFMTDGFSQRVAAKLPQQLVGYEQMQALLQELAQSSDRTDDATAICLKVESLPDCATSRNGWPRVFRLNGYGDYLRFKGEVSKVLAQVTGKQHSLQEVAVHEALANAMECRDGVARQHRARLRINKLRNRLIVRVKTSRIGFAGNALLGRLRSHPEEMFAFGEDAWMGRGIPIMLTTTDRMLYNNEGTEVLLTWKLG